MHDEKLITGNLAEAMRAALAAHASRSKGSVARTPHWVTQGRTALEFYDENKAEANKQPAPDYGTHPNRPAPAPEAMPTRSATHGGHSLTYIRQAFKFRDGADGLLYHHDWATGFQSLVFPTHEAARDWLTTQQHDKDTAVQEQASDI